MGMKIIRIQSEILWNWSNLNLNAPYWFELILRVYKKTYSTQNFVRMNFEFCKLSEICNFGYQISNSSQVSNFRTFL